MKKKTGISKKWCRFGVQLVTPLAVQIVTVPMHLVALDLYNNPTNPYRVAFVRREYVKTLLARWGRILPAFSIGGNINYQMQDVLKGLLGFNERE